MRVPHRCSIALAVVALVATVTAPLVLAPPAAAAPTLEWKQMIGSGLNAVAVDSAGNVVVTGFVQPASGDAYLVLSRLDPSGSPLWRRTFRPRGGVTRGVDVAIGPYDSIFLAGYVGSNHLEGGGWLLRRYTTDGDLVWSRVTPRWRRGVAVGIDAIAVGGGRLVVVGNDFGCCGDVANDGWVRAYGLDGTRLWRSPFEVPDPRGTNDGAAAIATGRSGGVYVAGWIATGPEPLDTERADHEVMVQKLLVDGTVSWTKVFFDRNADRDAATSIAVRADEVVVAAESGGSWVHRRPMHAWLARMSPSGSVRWTRSWGLDPDRAAVPASVSIDPAGSALVAGTMRDPSDRGTDAFLRAYSARGDLQWRRAFEEGASRMTGTDVAALVDGAALTGVSETDGWVWRLSS
ncbi:MAG: hypothetical protein ACXVQU_07915 [Actinomycetota bacterium]